MGCAWLGRNGTDGAALRAELAVLGGAYEAGFRYFDTSMAYGESELVLGSFLHELGSRRDSLFIASKALIPEESGPDEARRHVADRLDESLRRLKTDRLDLYQIHDVRRLDQVLAPGGAIEALEEARRAGKIRYAGLATRELALLEEGAASGRFDSVLTYSDFTPIDQSAASLIADASARGVGVVNGTPLSAGLLSGGDPAAMDVPLWHKESVRRRTHAAAVYRLCRSRGVSLLAAALQFPLRNPGIRMNLTGPATKTELEAGLDALEQPIPDSFWDELAEWNRERLQAHSTHEEGDPT
jgi:aryl-alcohol dehydrogenase-like predicted oxidoreductase